MCSPRLTDIVPSGPMVAEHRMREIEESCERCEEGEKVVWLAEEHFYIELWFALLKRLPYNHIMIRFEDTEAQSAFEAELESLMQEEPDMDSQERIELAFEITKLAFDN